MSRGIVNQCKGGVVARRECPNCHSKRIWKDGMRETQIGSLQRYYCRDCGYRFSESLVLSTNQNNKGKRQVCAILTEAKNLTESTPLGSGLAGATEKEGINEKLLAFAWHMKKNGNSEKTIKTYASVLRTLVRNGADLLDPNSVKGVLAELERSKNTKACITATYTSFLRFLGLSWNPPKYRYQQKIPFIPLESEIDALIAGCGRTTAAILQLLKETGMRIGEATRLKWTGVDFEKSTIVLNEPEKNSNPRIFRISTKLIGMLQTLPRKDEKVFGKSNTKNKQWIFNCQRKRLARKLGNPRLQQIHFHILRHWKATMEYHKTLDAWHVKKLLGHKSLQSTELYINIEQAIFNETNSDYHVKVAETLQDACKCLEEGFEYVTDMEGKKLFRKRG